MPKTHLKPSINRVLIPVRGNCNTTVYKDTPFSFVFPICSANLVKANIRMGVSVIPGSHKLLCLLRKFYLNVPGTFLCSYKRSTQVQHVLNVTYWLSFKHKKPLFLEQPVRFPKWKVLRLKPKNNNNNQRGTKRVACLLGN